MQLQPINQPTKSKRLEARVSPRVKSLLQQAAELQGSSISEFVSRSVEEVAKQIIREHTILQLSAAGSASFANALIQPAKPSSALKNAYSEFKKEVSSVK